MRIAGLGTVEEIKQLVRRRGQLARGKVGKARNKLTYRKRLEAAVVREATAAIVQKLRLPAKQLGSVEEWHPFYREMVSTILDLVALKRALAQLRKSGEIITKIRMESMRDIFRAENEGAAKAATRKYWGRVFSVLDRARKSIQLIRKMGKELARIPALQTELPTAIIAGMPNVGKTTLLRRWTDAKPKVASYPFTTQGLMIGKFEYKYQEVQLIDTPGLLDRDLNARNKIERRAAAALKHLGQLVVFVVDPSESCGYEWEKQLALYKQIKREFGLQMLVVINKADLVEGGKLEEVKKEFGGKEKKEFEGEMRGGFKGGIEDEILIEGEGIASNAREQIGELLGVGRRK